MSRHPPVKWAQRSDKVFITIELPDAKDVKFTLQPDGHFHFSAVTGADSVPYETDFDLYDKVIVDESKADVNSSNVCFTVKKAEVKCWIRLLRQEGRPPAFLVPDWDKWIDEESENDAELENSDEVRKKYRDMFAGFMDGMRLLMHDPANDAEGESTDEEEDDEVGEEKTEENLYAAEESEALVNTEKSGAPVVEKSGVPDVVEKSGAPDVVEKSGAPDDTEKSGAPDDAEKLGSPADAEKSGAPAGLKKIDILESPNYRYMAFGFLQALSLMMNAPANANAVDEESADEDEDDELGEVDEAEPSGAPADA